MAKTAKKTAGKKAIPKKAGVKKVATKKAIGKSAASALGLLTGDTAKKAGKTKAAKRAITPAMARKLAAKAPAFLTDATILDRLWETIESRRGTDTSVSHSARLLSRGTEKIAQKLGEEAVECVIEAVSGKNRPALIGESADVLYHLLVLWVDAGIRPEEVWEELARREGISGIAEKASRLKTLIAVQKVATTKIP